jgi:hypothetical protein
MAIGGSSGDLAQLWNGKTWQPLATPGATVLVSVSCGSTSNCVAVSGTGSGLTEVWNGSSWREVPAPAPSGALGMGLTSVFCSSAARCVAVGSYWTDPHGQLDLTLAEAWNGSAWRILPTPDPGPSNGLNAVACASQRSCMAVGGYTTEQGVAHNLAEAWNGKKWRAVRAPGPVGYGPGLIHVSCPSAASCMAVGNYLTNFGVVSHDLAERWNGKVWRVVKTAGPGGGLSDVSCTRAARCIAVGQTGSHTLAEMWNGVRWRLLRTRNP